MLALTHQMQRNVAWKHIGAAGIRLQVRSIMHARDWLPTTVTFGVEVTLQMPGQPDAPWLGKAGIDCGHQRLFLWSIGPDGRQFAAPPA